MSKRYFNWKLAIVLLIGVVVLAATAFGLRQWQRANRVERGLRLGSIAYDEHRWADAASQLGSYLGVHQNDVPVFLKYADAILNIRPVKSGNIGQAIAAYRSVSRVDPNNSEAVKKLTTLYLVIGAPGEAELISKRYLEKNHDPELRRLLALAMAKQRRFDEAVAQLKIVIANNPEQIVAYEALGQLSEQRPENFLDKPDHWFDEALKNNPSSASAYIIRAGFRLRNNDRVKALSDLSAAEKLDLSDAAVRLRLGQEFLNANVLDKAEEHLAAVQKVDPTSQTLWTTWAQLALKSQSKEKMLKAAETGLKELSAQPWDFMPVAAELFIQADQFDRAANCIDQLQKNDINPAAAAFLAGLLAERKGQGYEAVRCWQRAIGLGSKSLQIRLALASTLFELGDAQSAMRQLRTLVSEQPDFFDGQLALARLAGQTGNFAEAAEHADRAVQLAPTNIDAALLYVQTRVQLLAAHSKDTGKNGLGVAADLKDQDLDNQLVQLEKATNGSLKVKLLQFTLAMQRGDFAAAETLVSELKKSYPSEIEVSMAEVDVLTTQEKADEAVSVLNRTIEKFPKAVMPVRYLAGLYARQGKYEHCETTINDALKRIERPEAQRDLGLILVELYTVRKEQDKAYKTLSELDQRLPDSIPVKRRLLRCEQVIKNNAQSQKLVNDIQSLEGPEGGQWRYEQAKLWAQEDGSKNRHPQIIKLLKENLLANPDDQASRLLLAATYEKSGELQLAISTYREALMRSPSDIRIILPLVAALYKANDYDRADEILRQMSSEEIQNPELKKLEMQSYLRRGEIGAASTILENLFSGDPNNQSICLSLALLKMRQNKFAEAGELLNSLKSNDPNSLVVTVAQIELDIRQGKSVEALALCDQVVSRHQNAAAYILQGRAYAMLGNNDEAMKSMEKAASIEPNNSAAWAAKSSLYNYLGQVDNAADDIEKSLSLEPNNAQIQKAAITLFLRSRNPDRVLRANELIENGLQANPLDGELRMLKARVLLAKQTAPAIEQAKNILQSVTKDQPEVVDAWVLLGELTLRQGNTSEALDGIVRGLIRKPNSRALLMLKARAEMEITPTLAIATLTTLRDIDPNDVGAAIFLSNAYSAVGQPQKAVSILETQLSGCKINADVKIMRIALAAAVYKNGDTAKSQEMFDVLYQSSPDDPNILLTEVRLLKDNKLWSQIAAKAKSWNESHKNDHVTPISIAGQLAGSKDSEAKRVAEEILQKVLAENPENVEAMSVLGVLMHTDGRFAEAQSLYRRILKVQPDNLVILNNRAWILCEEQGKHQQALELSQQGLKIAPDYVDLIDTRGVAYYRLGEFDKAVQDFKKCIELYPPRSPAAAASRFHLGRAMVKLGRKEEAMAILKKAIELSNDSAGLSPKDMAEARQLVEKLSQPAASVSAVQQGAK